MSITNQAAGHQTATTSWRVVDIVIAAVIAVSSGVIFWAWNSTHHLLDVLFLAFPPSAPWSRACGSSPRCSAR